jgi:hypothetical protein
MKELVRALAAGLRLNNTPYSYTIFVVPRRRATRRNGSRRGERWKGGEEWMMGVRGKGDKRQRVVCELGGGLRGGVSILS